MKVRKVVIVILILILVILLILTGLNLFKYFKVKSTSGEISESIGNKIRIGFSLGTLKEERWVKDRDIFMAKAKELGADVFVQNANNDDEDQLKQVKYLLDQKINVLVIVPNDFKKASGAVAIAKKAGVKVISYDRLVLNSKVDLYISFDNVEVGKIMANYLIQRYPKGNYLIINGATSDNNTRMIKEGYDSILGPKIKSGDIKVLAEEWSPNWMSEYAFSITDKIIQSGNRIDAIIAGDDGLANGIIDALSEHRLTGKVPVVAQDADLAACQRIVEGTQLMTVYKPIDLIASKAAEMAIRLAKGEIIDVNNTIYDGQYDIPYMKLEPIAVDKSNIDNTVIKDGFHSHDDVYRYIK